MTGKQREESCQRGVPTLTENAMVTERTGGRRAFLAQTGAILLGAMAIVSTVTLHGATLALEVEPEGHDAKGKALSSPM